MFKCHRLNVDASGLVLFEIPAGIYTQITFLQVAYNSEDIDKGGIYELECTILQDADTICLFKAPNQNSVLNNTYTIDASKISNNKIGFRATSTGKNYLTGKLAILLKYH